jgi:CubicO group peptidase (beta-lactamase class C family)
MSTRPSTGLTVVVAAALAVAGALTVAGPAVATATSPTGTVATAYELASEAAGSPTVPARTSFRKTIAAGRTLAKSTLADTGASSMSLALTVGGRIVWRQTFGAVDTQGTRPTTDTVYGIGSVSKMLATVAVMRLVDEGRVSLDEPVVTYIRDFSMADPGYRQITVRMLLDHSAGLPGTDYANGISTQPYLGYADQVLRTLRTARLKTTPGAMAVYCNDCFTLAGLVVERVSGRPYVDYVREEILSPLKMRHSGYVTSLPPADDFAPVLGPDGSGPGPLEVTNIYASGGAYSTPSDMSRFARMLMNGGTLEGTRILSAAAIREMGTDQIRTTLDPTGTPMFEYGLGWDSVAQPGLEAVGVGAWMKGGDTVDYHALFIVAPGADMGVTVVGVGTGFNSSAAEALGESILLHALVDRGDIPAMPKSLGVTKRPLDRPTSADLKAMRGIYMGQGYVGRVASTKSRDLRMSHLVDGVWEPLPAKYVMRRDGRFWSKDDPSAALWVAEGWGRTYLVLSKVQGSGHYRADIIVGQKVLPSDSPATAWSSRVGQTWLLVNEIPSSFAWAAPTGSILAVPGLPGYLVFSSGGIPVDADLNDSMAPMFLEVPNAQGRDMNDVLVLPRGGEEWLAVGSGVLRPKASVPSLASGANAVTIGAEGYAEWRSAPAGGTVSVTGATDWKLYDGDASLLSEGSGSVDGVSAPAGALLLLFGSAGTTVSVVLG